MWTWLQQAVDEFNSQHPDVVINAVYVENDVFKRKIVTAMMAGNPPDIFQNWGGYMYLFRFVMQGKVVDLTPYMEKENPYIPGVPWKDTIDTGRLAQVTFNGKIYGVPFVLFFESIFYNKALFEKYNITMPTDNWTWDDFVNIIKEIEEKAVPDGIYPIALGNEVSWTGLIYLMNNVVRLAGADYMDKAILDPNVRLDAEPIVSAMKYIQELVDLNPFQPGWQGMDDNQAVQYLAQGKTFMEAIGSWVINQVAGLNETTAGNLMVVAWPHFPGEVDSNDLVGGGDAYAIASTCKDVDDAVLFLQYLTSPQVQKRLLLDPSIKTIPGIKMEYLNLTDEERANISSVITKEFELISKANYIENYWDQGLPEQIANAALEIIQPLFGKQITPEQAAAQLEQARQQWLKEGNITSATTTS